MTEMSVEGVARALSESMPSLGEEEGRLALTLYRLLAEGEPVSPEALAEAAGIDRGSVEALARETPGVFRDDDGRVVAFWGLAIPEMPHRFRVDGATLHAWCAWDTLFLPGLIGRTAHVESRCPTTGETISLVVAPGEVEGLSPAATMVSMLVPEGGFGPDVIQSFCHHVHFFASREAGERWLAEREGDDAFLLTVEEAFRLGELWNRHRFGIPLVRRRPAG